MSHIYTNRPSAKAGYLGSSFGFSVNDISTFLNRQQYLKNKAGVFESQGHFYKENKKRPKVQQRGGGWWNSDRSGKSKVCWNMGDGVRCVNPWRAGQSATSYGGNIAGNPKHRRKAQMVVNAARHRAKTKKKTDRAARSHVMQLLGPPVDGAVPAARKGPRTKKTPRKPRPSLPVHLKIPAGVANLLKAGKPAAQALKSLKKRRKGHGWTRKKGKR